MLQTRKNQGLFGKGLIGVNTSFIEVQIKILQWGQKSVVCNSNPKTDLWSYQLLVHRVCWRVFFFYFDRELLGQHTDNLRMVLTHTIYNELSTARNPNNMALIGVVFQTKPDSAATVRLLWASCLPITLWSGLLITCKEEDLWKHCGKRREYLLPAFSHKVFYPFLRKILIILAIFNMSS